MKNVLLILFILLFITVAGCNKEPAATPVPEDTIKIGVIYPQAGEDQKYGSLEGNAYKLAVNEINEAGGINGKKIELVAKDDLSSAEIARARTEELIENDKVVAVLGSFDSISTIEMAKVCQKKKTPLICSSSAVEEITSQGNEWVFRIGATSRYYASTIIDFLMEECPPETMGIIYNEGHFSKKNCEFLEEYASKKGIEIVISEEYTKGMINFKPLLKKIKEKNPSLLYIIVYRGDAALLMKQAKEVDLNPQIFAGAGIGFTDPDFIPQAGPDAEYVLTLTQWDQKADYPGNSEFVEKYREKYGDPDYHAALAYSAFTVLADALKRTENLENENIRAALKDTEMTTIIGEVNFEDYDGFTNQNRHRMIVLQVQNGKFVPVYPSEIKEKAPLLPVPPWSERNNEKTEENKAEEK